MRDGRAMCRVWRLIGQKRHQCFAKTKPVRFSVRSAFHEVTVVVSQRFDGYQRSVPNPERTCNHRISLPESGRMQLAVGSTARFRHPHIGIGGGQEFAVVGGSRQVGDGDGDAGHVCQTAIELGEAEPGGKVAASSRDISRGTGHRLAVDFNELRGGQELGPAMASTGDTIKSTTIL